VIVHVHIRNDGIRYRHFCGPLYVYLFSRHRVGIFILNRVFLSLKTFLLFILLSVLPLFHKEISILLHIHKKNTAFRQNSEKIRKFDKNSIRKQIRFGKRFDSIRISNRNQRFDSIRRAKNEIRTPLFVMSTDSLFVYIFLFT